MNKVFEVFIYYDDKNKSSSVTVRRQTDRNERGFRGTRIKEYEAGKASTKRIQNVMQKMTSDRKASLVYLDMPALAFEI